MSPIKIVVVFEQGRLGNQLFQFAAIKRAAPSARILNAGGMDGLAKWLHSANFIEGTLLSRAVGRIMKRIGRERLLSLPGASRLFSLITEQQLGQRCSIAIRRGLLPQVAILDGYFQDEFLPAGLDPGCFVIRPETMARTRQWIAAQTATLARNHYFVHVRRGDYVFWPTREFPAVLSSSWYRAQMDRIRIRDSLARFFILTDDIPYVQKLFFGLEGVYISRGGELDDLAIMALCEGGGVLSASSFSWWGSYYAKELNPGSFFIAPRYWFGWRKGEWMPPAVQTSWIQYVDGF